MNEEELLNQEPEFLRDGDSSSEEPEEIEETQEFDYDYLTDIISNQNDIIENQYEIIGCLRDEYIYYEHAYEQQRVTTSVLVGITILLLLVMCCKFIKSILWKGDKGMLNGLFATASGFDWSTIDLSGITSGVYSTLPVIIPVSVALMSIPIVWGFIRKMVKKH